MLGNNLNEGETQNTNFKVSKTIRKIKNNDSENPEFVEEIFYYDKDEIEKFNNFENTDFKIDKNASNVKKDVTVEEDENGTITKVVNFEYSILEDDINNEGDIIIETSIINDRTEHIEQGEKSFITNMDSIIMDETGGISVIESKEKLDKIEESIKNDNLSQKPIDENNDESNKSGLLNSFKFNIPDININEKNNIVSESVIDNASSDELNRESFEKSVVEGADGETSTTTEVVIDPETGKKKTVTKKVTRKVITKNIGEDLSEVHDGETSTTEIIVDPITGKKKHVTKRVIRKLINKNVSKEEVEPTIITKELPGGITETTELVVDPITGRKKYVTKRTIRRIITTNIVEDEEPSEIVEHEIISEIPASEVKEEIVEIPSEVTGKRKFVKRIIRYIKRINPDTGKEEIVEEPVKEIFIEPSEDLIPESKEEIIEVPSEVPGKKKYIKKIIKYIKRINPNTGKEEIIELEPIEENVSEKLESFSKLDIKNENIIFTDGKSEKENIVSESVINENTTFNVIPHKIEEISVEPKEGNISDKSKEETLSENEELKKNVKFRVFGKKSRRNKNKKSKNNDSSSNIISENSISEIFNESNKNIKKISELNEETNESNFESKKKVIDEKNKIINEEPVGEPIVESVVEETKTFEVIPEESISEPKEETIEEPAEEPIVEPIVEPVVEPVVEPIVEPVEEPVFKETKTFEVIQEETVETKEEIVEVPTEESGRKRFIKRIIKYIKKINPTTGEEEIVEEKSEEPAEEPVEEPIVESVVEETKTVEVIPEESISEPKEETIEEPVEEPVEEPAEEPAEEQIVEPIVEPVEEPVFEETKTLKLFQKNQFQNQRKKQLKNQLKNH
ncbi:hypothetical protein BCR36DRAFT_95591 [Piromyces finnis]|uniref:Uncharacterized protein n=1 Tax=Piromyces finnis TaxID=1754191 RepID=A0A1Y1V5I4_9FUNG|nr:hypothetical protein BCR36DRAFT_95591 [Piromyces finnis]|eukprot:ORX47291.1 hypothetical protein BCR36DRAFT_95591 [Piromyces finnis]